MAKIDSELVSLYFNPSRMGRKREDRNNNLEYQKGDILTLKGIECDDFQMPSKVYEVIKNITSFSDIIMDAYVVKQIEGKQSAIFSLTKHDCASLGIDFQPQLQLMPKTLNWECSTKKLLKKEFDKNDFSTYPVVPHSNMIEKIVLEISGISRMDGYGSLYQIGDITNIYGETIENGVYITSKVNPYKHYYGKNVTHLLASMWDEQISFNGCVYYEFNIPPIDPTKVIGCKFTDIFDVNIRQKSFRMNDVKVNFHDGCVYISRY